MTDAASVLDIAPIETGAEFVARVTPLLKPPHVWRFKPLFLDQLDDAGEEHEWLIDDIFSIGDKSVVGGPSQSGKSFLAIHAGMCIAIGMDFFGHQVSPGLVIYLVGEGARGVKKRLRAWRTHHNVAFDRKTPFVFLRAAVDLYRQDGDIGPLIEEIKAISSLYDLPLRMVVIDTLATSAIGADENSARDMGMVMANVARINAETHAHVCLVHHMNAGADRLRGSTAIYANIDQTLFVKRDPETKIRTVSLGKQRDDEDSLSFRFELASIGLGYFERSGKEATSCICVPVGEKDAIRRTEELKGIRLRPDLTVFMKALFTADNRYGMPVPEMLDAPSGVRTVVDYADVKRVFAQSTPDDDELDAPKDGETEEAAAKRKAEREKKRLSRLSKKLSGIRQNLVAFGVIGFGQMPGDPRWFIWWTGKPLRDFPNTQPKREPEPEAPAPELPVGFEDIPW